MKAFRNHEKQIVVIPYDKDKVISAPYKVDENNMIQFKMTLECVDDIIDIINKSYKRMKRKHEA